MQTSCRQCGWQAQPEDKYCGDCGSRLTSEESMPGFTERELRVSDIRYNLGLVYLKKGDYALAEATFLQILRDDPEYEMALNMLEAVKGKNEIAVEDICFQT